jgi:hypothetical protein
LAVVCYVGLAPLLRLLRVGRGDEFVSHHRNQALTTLLLLFLVLLWGLMALLLEVYLVRNVSGRPPDFMIAFPPGLGVWSLVTLVGVGMALGGSTRPVPLMARLARSQWLMRVALIGNSVLLSCTVLFVVLAMYASSITRVDGGPAPVYYLYDSQDTSFLGEFAPKLHALFCYRVSRVANERWGPGSVLVAPLTAENFRTAVAHGRLVIQIGHGASGAVVTSDGWNIWPDKYAARGADGAVIPLIGLETNDKEPLLATPGKDLQSVYLSACWAGEKATAWEQRFAPAEVVSFNRLSAGMEHLWWLWFDAPSHLRRLR